MRTVLYVLAIGSSLVAVAACQVVAVIPRQKIGIADVAWTPDGKHVVLLESASPKSGQIRVVEAASGKTVARGDTGRVSSGSLVCRDNTTVWLVGCSGNQHWVINSYDTRTGRQRKTWEMGKAEDVVVITPDQTKAVGIALELRPDTNIVSDLRLTTWDLMTGKAVKRPQSRSNFTKHLAISSDGLLFAAIPQRGEGEQQTVEIGEMTSGKVVQTLKGIDVGWKVVFSPTGRYLLTNGEGKDEPGSQAFCLWELSTGKVVQRFRFESKDTCDDLVFLPGGRLIMSAGFDRVIRVWDIGTAKQLRAFPQAPGLITKLVLSPDGKQLLSMGVGVLVLWDVESGKVIRILSEEKNE